MCKPAVETGDTAVDPTLRASLPSALAVQPPNRGLLQSDPRTSLPRGRGRTARREAAAPLGRPARPPDFLQSPSRESFTPPPPVPSLVRRPQRVPARRRTSRRDVQ